MDFIQTFDLTNIGIARNRQSSFSPLTPFIPLPKYFDSEWSYAQYRIPVQSSHISLSSSSSRSPTADVPDEERCVVGWVTVTNDSNPSRGPAVEHQLIALTYAGGWYRLSLPNTRTSTNIPLTTPSVVPMSGSPPKLISMPRPRSSSGSSAIARFDKGKEKDREKEGKESRECVLQEYRRFGRWDGWG